MSTKAKGGINIGSIAILLAILAAASIVIKVKGTPHETTIPADEDLYENITLSVLFTPKQRKNAVEIQVHVEGVRIVPPAGTASESLPVKNSPWNHIVRVPKGSSVSLYVYQPDAPKPGNLDCIISSKEGTISSSYRNDPGSIRCYVRRIGG